MVTENDVQRFALIREDVVVDVVVLPADASIEDAVHPALAADMRPCSVAVAPGWIYGDGAFAAPAEPELPLVDLATYTAVRRLQAEQAGTVWNGWPIHTDDRSQGKYLSELQAIALAVRVDGDHWKFADGVFRPVSNAEFPQLAIAAREHVRAVFGIEGALLVQIAAGTVTTTAEIDAAFEALGF